MKTSLFVLKCSVATLILFIAVSLSAAAKKQVKVSCVGNSITYGHGLENREQNSYPAQLQRLLGNDYLVGNFGKSGATLLNKGHRPYMQQQEFQKALTFAGDVVVIHLGINDTDPRNWPNYQDYFVQDYLALIDSFRVVNPKARILIARLTPITHRHTRFESGTRDWHREIQQAIETIAADGDIQLIDFHEPLYRYPFMLPDAIHPTMEGAGILANTVYAAITGNYGGLKMADIYSDQMVLQRDCPLDIHGMANAGDEVTVSIDKQKEKTKVGLDGKWSVVLKPLQTGKNYTLTIAAGKQTLRFNQVLAGEVWLCSGQSNMEFMLKNASTGKVDIPQSDNNEIRFYNMKPRWLTHATAWDGSTLDSLNHLQYYQDSRWTICSPKTAASFSAVAYYFGKMLQDSLGVPIGLISNAVGGSPTESWISRNILEKQFPNILRNWLENDFIQDWVRGRAALNIKKSTDKNQRHPYEPCYLYESGIEPLQQYPIKGVLWYQGESNAHNYQAHEKLFSLLVDSWRANWKNEKLPFYFVQLSSLNRPSWPLFRDSQRRLMQSIPYTGMVVSSDQGDSLDVHPTSKEPIGQRLAYWALNQNYGMKNVIASGPLFQKVNFVGEITYVSFDFSEGLHSANGEPLKTFEVAERNGIFHSAIAEIVGNQVKLVCDKVKKPCYVRYGWQPFTRANLINAAGIPASTFRSY